MTRPASERIRMLIADVDGTLVDEEKRLTPRAIAAVHKLHDAGIAFAVTSGRPPRGMAMLIEPLALEHPIAGFNGGAFVNPDLSVIERHALAPDVSQKAFKMIEQAGLDVWIYSGEEWYIRDPKAPHVDKEARTVHFGPTILADLKRVIGDAIKIVGVSDDYAKVAEAEATAKERLGDAATAARSQPYYLDVTNPKANKGEVVAYLSTRLGIPPEEIATIGDMPNDVRMFVRGGLAIAMGNASQEVQGQAHFTSASYTDDGFAKAVEQFVLPRAVR